MTTIHKILYQIWPGDDSIPEHQAVLMAKNALVCKQFGYDHAFVRIVDDHSIDVSYGDVLQNIPFNHISKDPRFSQMLQDPKIPYVMKGDILRFTLIAAVGGFYADLDLEVRHFKDSWLSLPYVCGFERNRDGAGKRPQFNPWEPGKVQPCTREDKVLCTGFFGAPIESPINREMSEFILHSYEGMAKNNCYPTNMWDVIDITVDPLVRIIRKHPEVKPFPMEVFFPWPIPNPVKSFTQHYYAGTQPGGWTFDQCKNEDCSQCSNKPLCRISREGRRLPC